jgi:hypothetical protein
LKVRKFEKAIFKPIFASTALWSRFNNDNAPSVNGLFAGYTAQGNNASVYVGRAWYGSELIPGRAQFTSNPGVYVTWVGEQRVQDDGEYLVVPDGCSCSWLSPSAAANHQGIVRTNDPTYNYVVGRKTFSDGRVAITKVATPAYTQRYVNQAGGEISDQATEILVCESSTVAPAATPTMTFANEACGE